MEDLRKHPRRAVQLAAEFTIADRSYAGLVTSLSAGGMFLATDERLPPQSTIEIAPRLGDEGSDVRVRARVVYQARRRLGERLLHGVGLALEQVSAEIEARLSSFVKRYPGPVIVDRGGRVTWIDGMRIEDEPSGVAFRLDPDEDWLSLPAGAHGAQVPLDDPFRRMDANLVLLVRLSRALRRAEGDRLELATAGRRLLPANGLARTSFVDMCEVVLADIKDPRSALLATFAVQMWLLDVLAAGGYQLEWLGGRRIEVLEQIRRLAHAIRARVAALPQTMPDADEDLQVTVRSCHQALADLDEYLDRLVWAARGTNARTNPNAQPVNPPPM